MAEKTFLGFQVIDGTKEGFDVSSLTEDYVYFVRTGKDENNGYTYVNGKMYGNVHTTELGDAVGLTKNEEGKWVTPEGVIVQDGVTLATDVAKEMVDDEKVIAEALNTHQESIETLNTAMLIGGDDVTE